MGLTRVVALCALLFSSVLAAKLTEIDRVIAIVNDKVITSSELDYQLFLTREDLRQNNQSIPDTADLRKQVLEQLIVQSLQIQVAERSGIHIDDIAIDEAIADIAKANKLSVAQFRDILSAQGIDYPRYRQRIKDEKTVVALQQRDLFPDLQVSEQELEQFMNAPNAFGAMNTEYRLGHILVSLPTTPTPEDAAKAEERAKKIVARLQSGTDFATLARKESQDQAALSGGDLGWRKLPELPQLFEHRVGSMKVNDVAQPIRSASGFHVIKLIDKRKTKAPEHHIKKTNVRHILIKNNALASETDVKNKLNELKFKIEQGESFDDLAKAYSEDLASASKGGNLGWVTDEVLVPEFVTTMNETEKGRISEPFASPFGWHILEVIDRATEDNGEAFLRNQAKRMLLQRKFEEKLANWQRQMRDEAYVRVL